MVFNINEIQAKKIKTNIRWVNHLWDLLEPECPLFKHKEATHDLEEVMVILDELINQLSKLNCNVDRYKQDYTKNIVQVENNQIAVEE